MSNIVIQRQKAATCEQYSNNPETKKVAAREKYSTNPETKKAAAREQYSTNPETKKAAIIIVLILRKNRLLT